MNKEQALQLLIQNLEEYLQQGFRFHPQFIKEFKELLHDAKGHEKEIFSLLIKQLNYVKQLGRQVNNADGNEILKYMHRDFYSLHLTGRNFNLRVLMTFYEEHEPIFLAAFFERSGKKASGYERWLPVLENRYQQM